MQIFINAKTLQFYFNSQDFDDMKLSWSSLKFLSFTSIGLIGYSPVKQWSVNW
jgi:hypothetical protein